MFLYSLLSAGDLIREINNFFFNFSSPVNASRTVMLWLAILLVVAFALCKRFVPDEKQPLVNRVSLFVAIGFAALSIGIFSTFNFIEDEMTAMTFYPLLVCILCIVGGMIAIFLKPTKLVKIISFSGMGASFVAVLVCMTIYQVSGDAAEVGGVADSGTGLYLAAIAIVVAIVAVAFLCDREKKPFDARTVAFAAMSVTMSFALSYVRIFRMPLGGSITFVSWLPVMLFSYMFGTRKGVLAGLILGVLQALQDPWIIHPAQFALDYAVSFTSLGLAGCIRSLGLFRSSPRLQFSLGAAVAGLFRFLCAFFSGVFAFGSYGAGYAEQFNWPALANPWFYSLVYQSMYVIPELLILICAGVALFSYGNFRRTVEKYSAVH